MSLGAHPTDVVTKNVLNVVINKEARQDDMITLHTFTLTWVTA